MHINVDLQIPSYRAVTIEDACMLENYTAKV